MRRFLSGDYNIQYSYELRTGGISTTQYKAIPLRKKTPFGAVPAYILKASALHAKEAIFFFFLNQDISLPIAKHISSVVAEEFFEKELSRSNIHFDGSIREEIRSETSDDVRKSLIKQLPQIKKSMKNRNFATLQQLYSQTILATEEKKLDDVIKKQKELEPPELLSDIIITKDVRRMCKRIKQAWLKGDTKEIEDLVKEFRTIMEYVYLAVLRRSGHYLTEISQQENIVYVTFARYTEALSTEEYIHRTAPSDRKNIRNVFPQYTEKELLSAASNVLNRPVAVPTQVKNKVMKSYSTIQLCGKPIPDGNYIITGTIHKENKTLSLEIQDVIQR